MRELREQEAKKKIVRLKIDIVTTFNGIIDDINKAKIRIEEARRGDIDISDILPDSLDVVDVRFKIISTHLEDIANRAIELDDQKLITLCKGLGLITEEETVN